MNSRAKTSPETRQKRFKEVLKTDRCLQIMEAHNGLAAIIASDACTTQSDGTEKSFDGLWISSFTDSAAKGCPDNETVDSSSRLQTIQSILYVTDLPVIVDGDTGGNPVQFACFCDKLAYLGVSAIVIEDQKFPKQNSLKKDTQHVLEDPQLFADKIAFAKRQIEAPDFLIIARIESFIAKQSLADALERAERYLNAGADGILIHSNQSTPEEIFAFAEGYNTFSAHQQDRKPLFCVPTTYNTTPAETLHTRGFNVAIHANQLLRAAHLSMKKTAQAVLTASSSACVSEHISPVTEIFKDVHMSPRV